MGRRSKALIAATILLAAYAFALPTGARALDDWTFMVYLDGANNLEDAGIDDFLEMSAVGSSDKVNFVVLFDRLAGYSTGYDDWTDTRRGVIGPGDVPDLSWGTSVGEKNMGDPATAIEFAQWAIDSYPASNYAFIFWNHGGGWRNTLDKDDPPVKAVCWDDESGGDCLYMSEVRSALATIESTRTQIDLVGFDACLMGMIEVAFEIRDCADVMVGSEETEPWDGWPYTPLATWLVANPTATGSALGATIVDEYYASYGNDETQSAIDLAQVRTIPTVIDDLAQAMIDHWDDDPAAAKTAALAVKASLDAAVINEQHGDYWPGAHGLAVYFPEDALYYDSDYDTTIEFSANTQWNEFLQEFYSSMAGSWIADARGRSQQFYYVENVDLYDFCANLNMLAITTTSPLPAGQVSAPYSVTLQAEGGQTPYTWSLCGSYGESDPGGAWNGGGAGQGWSADDECWSYALPFTFSFYGRDYNSVYVCSNGFLDFASSYPDPWSTTQELIDNVRIAPLWDDLVTDGAPGQDVYITEASGYVIIRWLGESYFDAAPVNFEVVLYQNGDIRFNYGAGNDGLWPVIGISSGNGSDYVVSTLDGLSTIPDVCSRLYHQTPAELPPGLSLDSVTGTISGVPTLAGVCEFDVKCSDSSLPTQSDNSTFELEVTGPATAVAHGVVSIGPSWKWVKLPAGFTDPVVVAGPASKNDSEPGVVRLRYVGAGGFAIRFQEWDYLDGAHAAEKARWIAVEKGVHDLGGGDQLIAGSFWTNRTDVGSGRWQGFTPAFSVVPVVVAQIQTNVGPAAVTDRATKTFAGGFRVAMQEEEAGGSHPGEEIGYLAVSQEVTDIGGVACHVRRPWVRVKHTGAWASTDLGGVRVFAEEERSADTEVEHWAGELVGLIGLGSEPPFVADMQTCREADTCVLRIDKAMAAGLSVSARRQSGAPLCGVPIGLAPAGSPVIALPTEMAPIARNCDAGGRVRLSAPRSISDGGDVLIFQRWQVDGKSLPPGLAAIHLKMTGNRAAVAVYAPAMPR